MLRKSTGTISSLLPSTWPMHMAGLASAHACQAFRRGAAPVEQERVAAPRLHSQALPGARGPLGAADAHLRRCGREYRLAAFLRRRPADPGWLGFKHCTRTHIQPLLESHCRPGLVEGQQCRHPYQHQESLTADQGWLGGQALQAPIPSLTQSLTAGQGWLWGSTAVTRPQPHHSQYGLH